LMMPPKQFNQRLNPDEGLPQVSDQNQLPFHQPSNQTLSTIIEGFDHPTFGDSPELQLHQLATMSTTAAGSSQNGGGTSSTQTNGGDPFQSPQGCSHQYNMSRVTLSSTKSKCKIGAIKLKKMKLH
jgi:hypothetical protein